MDRTDVRAAVKQGAEQVLAQFVESDIFHDGVISIVKEVLDELGITGEEQDGEDAAKLRELVSQLTASKALDDSEADDTATKSVTPRRDAFGRRVKRSA